MHNPSSHQTEHEDPPELTNCQRRTPSQPRKKPAHQETRKRLRKPRTHSKQHEYRRRDQVHQFPSISLRQRRRNDRSKAKPKRVKREPEDRRRPRDMKMLYDGSEGRCVD